MEVTFIGIGAEAASALKRLKQTVPGRYLGVFSKAADAADYDTEQLRFCLRPSVDAAALRILPKLQKLINGSEVVFLLSELSGKPQEDIICNLVQGLNAETVISIVWYEKRKHGQRGIETSLERLADHSAVVAIPQKNFEKTLELIPEYVGQLLLMYSLPYANAAPEAGKKALQEGGILHLTQNEIPMDELTPKRGWKSLGMAETEYNPDLDTLLNYSCSALLSLAVPPGTPPAIIRYICEYVFYAIDPEGEFNFHITVAPELQDCVAIKLLGADTITAKIADLWEL